MGSLRGGLVVCLVMSVLTGACDAGSTTSAVAGQISYTCCEAKDIETLYRPGDDLALHWIVNAPDGPVKGSPQVELTATLTGPYSSVETLKAAPDVAQSAPGKVAFTAVPVRPSGTPDERPVSTIEISSDAEPGYYNLDFAVVDDGGSSVSGASVIRVVAKD